MKKYLQNWVVKFITLVALYVTTLSARSSMWPNMPNLTIELQQSSMQFRSMAGSNRLSEYAKLESILNAASINRFTVEDVVKVFGIPNKQTSKQMEYWLQEDESKSILKIDIKEKMVLGYKTINN